MVDTLAKRPYNRHIDSNKQQEEQEVEQVEGLL
jgi:hypothetical protein